MNLYRVSDHEKSPGPCSLCGAEAEDRCEQMTGPCCHKSLTFEDCVGASAARTKKLFDQMDRDEAAWKEKHGEG